MITLLWPLGLAAVSALIIPILIHLVRRSERQLVNFAALRWLRERNQPRKQRRLDERLLLALRLLLLAVLALLLALPAWRAPAAAVARCIAVTPGLDLAAARAAVNEPSAEWHWLAPGFPTIESAGASSTAQTDQTDQTAGFSSLVRELDARLPANTLLSILVSKNLDALDAERLSLSRDVQWIIRPQILPAATLPAADPAPLHISVRHDEVGVAELQVVQAVARAWGAAGFGSTLDIAPLQVPIPADAALVFWLGAAPTDSLRAWVQSGGTAVMTRVKSPDGYDVAFGHEPSSAPAVAREQPFGRGRLLSFRTALTTAEMPALLDPAFPEALRHDLRPTRARSSQAVAEAYAPAFSAPVPPAPASLLTHWLAVLAALLFAAERWLATGRRRGAE